MKLSIVCSADRLNLLPQLRISLDGLFIETLTWYAGKADQPSDDFNELNRCLDYSSFVLCIVDPADLDSSWFHYVMGFQRGCLDRLALFFSPEDRLRIPEWVSRYPTIVGDSKDVFRYYSGIEEIWSEEAKPVLARRAISDRNIEVSARSFIEAVKKGDRFLLGLFLDAGFSPSLRDDAGVPVLISAIRCGHTHLVGPLLSAGADLKSVAEDRSTTALMDAASSGFSDLTEELLNGGSDLEHASCDGQTAVTLAVGNGRIKDAVMLIRAGADVDKTDSLGMSARKYAILYNQETILAAIQESEVKGLIRNT